MWRAEIVLEPVKKKEIFLPINSRLQQKVNFFANDAIREYLQM